MSESSQDNSAIRAVVGTAGHIDHGKSSLVEGLTGTHPSRLKEEQERGMTIDIGYAEYRVDDQLSAGIIDVPGHEKFIRNMVAGASGVDFVMLVVAADDGVMPQTREHLQIMRLIGIERGMTVITKTDLVDEELLEIVQEDVRDYLTGTFLGEAPVICLSNTTGEGLDDVKAALDEGLRSIPERRSEGVFRMPVQRAFSVKGHGTVVTGVPVSGAVSVGEELELLPAGRKVRVRGLQVHHVSAERASAGQRCALNVTDVNYREVERGNVVAARGYFGSAAMLEARLEYLDHHDLPLRNDVPVRFHTGTVDLGGRLVLLDRKVLLPGESGLVQIRLEEPVVCAAGDRYVVRLASPVITLGGGQIVGETRWRFKRFRDWLNENLEQKEAHLGDRKGYLAYVVRSEGKRALSGDEIGRALKVDFSEIKDDVAALVKKKILVAIAKGRAWLHADMFKAATESVSQALLALHEAEKLQAGFQLSQLTKATKLDAELIEAVVERQIQRNKYEILQGRLIRNKAYRGSLSNEDVHLVDKIVEMHVTRPFSSPIYSEIATEIERPIKKVRELMRYLTQMGRLVPLTPDLALDVDAAAEAESRLVERLQQGEMPSNEFKDIIETTRKYVIPLLEFFDKKGISVRNDNARRLADGWESKTYAAALEAESE